MPGTAQGAPPCSKRSLLSHNSPLILLQVEIMMALEEKFEITLDEDGENQPRLP